MFDKYLPDIFENTVYEINFNKYYEKGFRAIIFDIDNTLVLHDAKCNSQCKNLINNLKRIGFKIFVLSNNHFLRTKEFCDVLKVDYIYDANKPFINNYLQAIKRLGIEKEKCIFVGDQLLTDIRGAKQAGIVCILVKPIGKEKYFHVKVKRVIEKIILFVNRRIILNKKIDFNGKTKICYIAKYDNKQNFYKRIKEYIKDKRCDIIELRLDTLYEKQKNIKELIDITNKADKYIKKNNKYSLATFRTKQDGSNCDITQEEYYQIISSLYKKTRVDIIDIEYRYYSDLKTKFSKLLNDEKTIILSFHDFNNHYDKHSIRMLFEEMTKEGKNVVKIAIFTHKKQEVLDLMEEAKKIEKKAKNNIFFVIIAMGKIGLVSRIYNEYTKTKIVYIDNDEKDIGPLGNVNIDKYSELRNKIKELI